MPENTFDIVSKIDLQEVSNAIQQALKEIHTRFDLKDSKSNIELEKDAIVLHSADEYKLKAVNDILQQKLVKRGVSLKGLTYGAVEPAAGGTAKRKVTMQQGIAIEKAREIVKLVKDSKKKAQARSREIWCGSAAKTATRCRRSLPCSSSTISASICSSRITARIERELDYTKRALPRRHQRKRSLRYAARRPCRA